MKITLVYIGVAFFALTVVVASYFICPPPSPVVLESPEDIIRELNKSGEQYEGKWLGPNDDVAHHGFHIKRKNDDRTWKELGYVNPAKFHHHVIVTPNIPHLHAHGSYTLNDWVLNGDEEDIKRILNLSNP